MIGKRLYIYYSLLLVILCTWFSTESAPPMPLRIIFLSALVIPAFYKNTNLLVPVITCFTALAYYGFSRSYMPTEKSIYLLITIILLLFNIHRLGRFQRPPILLLVFCSYILIVDLFTGENLEEIDYSILIITLSFYLVSLDGYEKNLYMVGFLIVTLILSLYFFTYGQSSAVEVSETGRRYWRDPNYLGNVCSMGLIFAYNVLVNKLTSSKLFKRLCFVTVAVGMLMLVMNASRGAFLSMTVALVIITLFSKVKLKTKISMVILIVLAVFLMYSFGAFDVLSDRIMNEDDDTGNGRTIIWEAKMLGYLDLSMFEKLFGIGYKGGFYLAIPGGYGFHNDYLAFLVDYGLVGLILFISLLFYPIKLVWNNPSKRIVVLSLILFLMTCCATLEPFTMGYLTYWYFYMLIVLYSRWSNYSSQRGAFK